MIEFSDKLEEKISGIIKTAVGPGTDSVNYVKTFDDHLHDVEITSLPFVVVTTRTAEKAGESEIGAKYDLKMYTVHIYYLDTTPDYASGKTRRSNILSRIRKALEANRRLDNLQSTDPNTDYEYVYDSTISAILFDSSGQEEFYSFISELYLNVYTATK